MNWPTGEDFIELVSRAVKDRKSVTGVRMRDALARPEIVDRTVTALETIVDRIDTQMEEFTEGSESWGRRETARAVHYDWLVWYQAAAMLEAES